MKSGEPFALAAFGGLEASGVGRRWCARSASSPPTPTSWCRHPQPHPGNIAAGAYDRWLSTVEPDPRDLFGPFRAKSMMMWPISTRVNNPANDEPEILEPVEPITDGIQFFYSGGTGMDTARAA